MRYRIFRCLDKNECDHAETGEAIPFLRYAHDGWPTPKEEPGPDVVSRNPTDATLEELVRLCDQMAENRNAHDFVGVHRLLGAVLFRQYGRMAATRTMMEIASLGGLDRMNGVACDEDAYAELGVGESGRDWDGSYGK